MTTNAYGIPDTAGYDRQTSDVQYRYNTDSAMNAYGRFLSQQRGSRSLDQMQQGMQRQLPGQYAQFNQRGLAGPGVQSGVQQRAMQNYLGDYANNYTYQQQQNTQDLQQYDLQQGSMDANLNSQLAAIQSQKQNDIANAALGIGALRQLLGGI